MKPSKLFDEITPGQLFSITQRFGDNIIRESLCVRDSVNKNQFSVIALRLFVGDENVTSFVTDQSSKNENFRINYQTYHIKKAEQGYNLLCYEVEREDMGQWLREWRRTDRLVNIVDSVKRVQEGLWIKEARLDNKIAKDVIQLAGEIDNDTRIPGEDAIRG